MIDCRRQHASPRPIISRHGNFPLFLNFPFSTDYLKTQGRLQIMSGHDGASHGNNGIKPYFGYSYVAELDDAQSADSKGAGLGLRALQAGPAASMAANRAAAVAKGSSNSTDEMTVQTDHRRTVFAEWSERLSG